MCVRTGLVRLRWCIWSQPQLCPCLWLISLWLRVRMPNPPAGFFHTCQRIELLLVLLGRRPLAALLGYACPAYAGICRVLLGRRPLARHMLLCCSGPGYCRVCAWLHVPVRTHHCMCTPCTNLSGTTAFIGSVAGPVCFWCGCWCAGKEVSCWEASGAPGKVHKLLSKAHVHPVRLHCC